MANQSAVQTRLVAELAVAVARFVPEAMASCENEDGFIWHAFQGPFDEGCYILWELGVALAHPPSGTQGMTWEEGRDWGKRHGEDQWLAGAFKFMPADETRAIIMAHRAIAPSLFDRLLEVYLYAMVDYETGGCPPPGVPYISCRHSQ